MMSRVIFAFEIFECPFGKIFSLSTVGITAKMRDRRNTHFGAFQFEACERHHMQSDGASACEGLKIERVRLRIRVSLILSAFVRALGEGSMISTA